MSSQASQTPHSSYYDEPSIDCSDINSVVDACERNCRVTSAKKKIYCVDNCGSKPAWHESFASTVTPLSNLISYTGLQGAVEFFMRRKNKVTTLQWEPFTGNMGANGVAYLLVPQSLQNLPPYPMTFTFNIKYKSIGRSTFVEVVPDDKNGHIRFYLNADGTGTGVVMGDSVSIPGGCISWIVKD